MYPSKAESLELEIAELETSLGRKKETLSIIRKGCKHSWSPIWHTPRSSKEYTDHMEALYYGKNWTPRTVLVENPEYWSRKCTVCGLIQTTDKVKLIPSLNGLKKETPDFGGRDGT